MIALGHGHADPLLGVRVEVDESRRLRLDLGGIGQLAIDPQTQRHRRRVRRTLAWQSELELVVGIEIEAVRGFDVARIEPAEVLEAQAVLDFDRFRQRHGRHRALSDPPGGSEVLLHQDWRDRQDIGDVVESLT